VANFTIGLDLGQSRDYSALVITERVQVLVITPPHYESFSEQDDWEPGPIPDDAYRVEGRVVFDEYHVRHIQRWQLGTPYPAVVDDVSRLMLEPVFRRRAHLVIDSTGVGGAVADMFTQAFKAGRLGDLWPQRVTLTAGFSNDGQRHGHYSSASTAHKGDLVARVVSLFERGRVVMPPGLPQSDALEKELRAFKLKQSARTGALSFEAEREADHDDLVIALALSVWVRHRRDEPRYLLTGGEAEPREKPWSIATNPPSM
jgi:hypothetical protein